MDIRQWLDNTADRAPPDQEVDVLLPDFLRPRSEPEQGTRKYPRKRKRASSDSSIIEARQPHHKRGRAANYAHSSDEVGGAEYAVARSRSSQSSQRSRSTPSEAPQKTYERRARHKTKPDRYEPKSKKQRKERETREDRKAKPKRRKSHRSGDGGRTTGLVQSFQLKNGPKNNRLTLKPEATAGLFKHGRASAQVAGRGGGLPDLVFNEMRFLQKPKVHQDELPKDGAAHHTAKTDRKKQQEEEISAYFAAQRPGARHESEDERSRQVTQTSRPHAQYSGPTLRPAEQQATDPPVELPEKPFLGFGSKGAHLDSKDMHAASDSYYTWSDSAARPAKPTSAHDATSRRDKRHERLLKVPERKQPTSDNDLPAAIESARERRISGPTEVLQRGTWHQSRRTRGPAQVELYRPPLTSAGHNDYRQRSVTKTTLQSLPRQASVEHSKHAKDAGQSPYRETSIDYHTSDILNIHDVHEAIARSGHRRRDHQQDDGSRAHQKENQDPRSSSSTGKLLRRMREVVEHPAPRAVPPDPTRSYMPEDFADVPNGVHHHRKIVEQPVAVTATLNETRRASESATGLRERRLQSAAGLGPMLAPVSSRQSTVRKHDRPAWRAQNEYLMPFATYNEEDEMLDNGPDAASVEDRDHFVYANSRQAEELVHGVHSDRTGGLYEMQAEQLERMPSDALRSQLSLSAEYLPHTTPPVRGLSIEREFRSERSAFAAEHTGVGTLDEFAGFWKPNKLY